MRLRQLHPEPAELSAEEATTGLRLGELAPPDRPYLVLNMVATLDGRTAIGGRSAPLSSRADRELFHGLRTQADAVMAGGATVRAERYGPVTKNAELQARRERDALAAVVSGRLDLPPDLPLLQDPASRVAILTGSTAAAPDVPAQVVLLRGEAGPDGHVALAPLLRELRTEYGVRSIVCEGGSVLNRSLLAEGLVDELFLALAPKLAGGDPLTAVTGPPVEPPLNLQLLSVLESEDHLFLRYRRAQDPLQRLE